MERKHRREAAKPINEVNVHYKAKAYPSFGLTAQQVQYLSNFTHVDIGIYVRMPDGKTLKFKSVELAFHAAKTHYLLEPVSDHEELTARYAVDGEYGIFSGSKQKTVGGRPHWKKEMRGAVLDKSKWDTVGAKSALKAAVCAREERDPTFRRICAILVSKRAVIVHRVRGAVDDKLEFAVLLQQSGRARVVKAIACYCC
jgi:hypothetical protein